jgi:aryl-alcohol dehydrogenase-like predicted oxidoreductase
MIEGFANSKSTREYKERFDFPEGQFHEYLKTRIWLSAFGIGSFGGLVDAKTDVRIAEVVKTAALSGINVFDTAAHYRYGRSPAAVGQGLQAAIAEGIPRSALFVVAKGGFLTFPEGRPEDFSQWFQKNIEEKGLGKREDLANNIHLLSPEYIDYQINACREQLGLNTLDAFLLDQPEIHIPIIGKEALNQKIGKVFITLEKAVQERRIQGYGLSAFHGFRLETDDPGFQSITSMLGWAEKAAREVQGTPIAKHSFRIIQFPFNQVLLEAFTRFNHATGEGNIASTVQAAYQLGVYPMASHTLFKGHLAKQSIDIVAERLKHLSPVERALQFNRSTPGMKTSLIGISQLAHLDPVLKVAAMPVLERKTYLSMYAQA